MTYDDNPYVPHTGKLVDVKLEAAGERAIKTFKVVLDNEEEKFVHKPGQTGMLGVLGTGESMFAISSPPVWEDRYEFSVMRVGKVTSALHNLEIGSPVTVRGPFGNGFPVEEWKGKNVHFIGAGIGLAPLRSVYAYVLDEKYRKDFGDVSLIYGARTSTDLIYRDAFEEYFKRDDLSVDLCIDWKFGAQGMIDEDSEEGWGKINMKEPGATEVAEGQHRFTCFVPQLVEVKKPSPENAIAVTCGPPIAIKFITQALQKLGFADDQIYTTLENRMKCGIGKCGRCNIGEVYVCVDGPVFSVEQIDKMYQEF